jgi:transcriptional regulator with XRE-family HTH domain
VESDATATYGTVEGVSTNGSVVRWPLGRFNDMTMSVHSMTRSHDAEIDSNKANANRGRKSMARTRKHSFGQVIRERRRQLDLTQEETARGIKTSAPYVGHLESGIRHPSDKTLTRLAEVLGLDRRELFFLANPRALALVSPDIKSTIDSTWDDFRKNEQLRRVHNIARDEMEILSRVALLGGVPAARDFIYILNTVRHAVGR